MDVERRRSPGRFGSAVAALICPLAVGEGPASLRGRLPAGGVSYGPTGESPAGADQLLISGNAVKFTAGGQIVVAVRRHGAVQIEVADTGIGISEERIADLCRPFVQVRMSSRGGITAAAWGCSSPKALIDRHGGTLQIESHPDKGTTVRIALPIERLFPAKGLMAPAVVNRSPQHRG